MDMPGPDFQKFLKILKPEVVLIEAYAYPYMSKTELNSRWTVPLM
jgi:hypothetical protein